MYIHIKTPKECTLIVPECHTPIIQNCLWSLITPLHSRNGGWEKFREEKKIPFHYFVYEIFLEMLILRYLKVSLTQVHDHVYSLNLWLRSSGDGPTVPVNGWRFPELSLSVAAMWSLACAILGYLHQNTFSKGYCSWEEVLWNAPIFQLNNCLSRSILGSTVTARS